MPVTETGLILLAEPIPGVGSQPELSGRLFGMKEGEVTPAMRVVDRLGVRAPSPAARTPTSRSSTK